MPIEVYFSQINISKCGVLQRSTLGPLLFLIYIKNLINALETSTAHHFVDDTKWLYDDKNPSVRPDDINCKVKLVTDLLRANKRFLNELKTKLRLFKSINKLNLTMSNIKLNEYLLTLVKLGT